jgi:hypothetical protein
VQREQWADEDDRHPFRSEEKQQERSSCRGQPLVAIGSGASHRTIEALASGLNA